VARTQRPAPEFPQVPARRTFIARQQVLRLAGQAISGEVSVSLLRASATRLRLSKIPRVPGESRLPRHRPWQAATAAGNAPHEVFFPHGNQTWIGSIAIGAAPVERDIAAIATAQRPA